MFLVIDAGNTQCKGGLFQGADLHTFFSFPELGEQEARSITEEFPVEAALVSKVGIQELPGEQWFRSMFTFLELTPVTSLPFRVEYQTPETLGNDRLANAAGAVATYPDDTVLVIDAGTCVTYDLIDRSVFLGGAISPGLTMRSKAMHNFTHRLPLVEPNPKDQEVPLTGKDTEGCLQSGLFNSMRFEMDGSIDQYLKEYPSLKVVLTGGDGPLFEKALKSPIFADPHHTLKGLNSILRHHVS